MKVVWLLSFFTVLNITSGCMDDGVDTEMFSTNGIMVDRTGLDGCGLMIQLDDSSFFEPISWPNNESPKEGDRISFDYTIRTDLGSICMSGKMVEVTAYSVY